MSRIDPHDLACQHAVEMVTDYFERVLPKEQAEVLELHLVLCDGCRTYVRTMKRSIETTRALGGGGAPMQSYAKAQLLSALSKKRAP